MRNNLEEKYMYEAYRLACDAAECSEIPVGAVIVKDGKIISVGKNNREETNDATGHAEIIAIREACRILNSWHLDDCELYVTLEPCPMCMGAIINSRIKRLVYGAKDPKAGACGSVVNLNCYPFNHKPDIDNGHCECECAEILTKFFKNKRN